MRFPFNPLSRITAKARAEGYDQGRLDENHKIAKDFIERELVQVYDPYAYPRGPKPAAYQLDYPVYFATPQSPRRKPTQVLDSFMLRRIADTFDIARAAIDTLKRQVAAQPRQIVSKDKEADEDSVKGRIKEAEQFFSVKGGLGGFNRSPHQFEAILIEDLLVLGSYAVLRDYTLGGQLWRQTAIDAATIRPRVTAFGWPDEDIPYEQWIQGMQVAQFTADELVYDGINARSWTPYFNSPLEYLIATITAATKADEWNRSWLTDGTAPGQDTFTLPKELTPDQVEAWRNAWDKFNSGNTIERQKVKFLPEGAMRLTAGSRRDMEFQEYELWLLRRVCSVFGVTPASMGYSGEQYKVSQADSMKSTTEFGAGSIMEQLKAFYDDTLMRLGFEDLEFAYVTDEEEAAASRAKRLQAAVGRPWLTVNEARAQEGYDPLDEGGELYTAPAPVAPGSGSGVNANADKDEPDGNPKADKDTKRGSVRTDTRAALKQWESKVLNRLKANKPADCPFVHDSIPTQLTAMVRTVLALVDSPDSVADAFNAAASTYETHYGALPQPLTK